MTSSLSFRDAGKARGPGIHNHKIQYHAPPCPIFIAVAMDSGLAPSARPGMTGTDEVIE